MTNSDLQGFARTSVFHPPGAIRLLSPAEDAVRETREHVSVRPATAGRSRSLMFERARGTLRRFARVWAQAQMHRAGL